jgi:predicted ArsR family transcriptional regulator
MTPKRGRPLGVKAFAVIQTVAVQPMPLRELAARLRLSYTDAQWTVERLARRGLVQYGELQHNTGGRPARLVQHPSAENATAPACIEALRALWRTR